MYYIYKITNLINNKIYIGLTTYEVNERYKSHLSAARSNRKITGIDAAIRKYGEENFKVEIVEELEEDIDLLNEREQYWIAYYNCFKDNTIGYNQTEGGGGIKGYEHTPEDRYKCGNATRGKKVVRSQAWKDSWRASYTGHKFPESVCKQRSIDLKLAYAEGRRKPNGKGVGGRGPMTEEEKKIDSENQSGKKNMHNDSLKINMVVWKDEIDSFLTKDWDFKFIDGYMKLSRKNAKYMGIIK